VLLPARAHKTGWNFLFGLQIRSAINGRRRYSSLTDVAQSGSDADGRCTSRANPTGSSGSRCVSTTKAHRSVAIRFRECHRQLEWTSPSGTKRAARSAAREGGRNSTPAIAAKEFGQDIRRIIREDVLRIKSPASSCGYATVRSGPTISDHAESRWSSTASEQHLQGRSGFWWEGGQPYGQLEDGGHVDSLIAVRRRLRRILRRFPCGCGFPPWFL
jgi:hypothetical protein